MHSRLLAHSPPRYRPPLASFRFATFRLVLVASSLRFDFVSARAMAPPLACVCAKKKNAFSGIFFLLFFDVLRNWKANILIMVKFDVFGQSEELFV